MGGWEESGGCDAQANFCELACLNKDYPFALGSFSPTPVEVGIVPG